MKQFISIFVIAAVAGVSCNNATSKENKATVISQQRSLDSMEMEIARQQIVDSMNEAIAAAAATKGANNTPRAQTRTIYVNGNSQPAAVVNEAPVAEKNKKGWSAKAKGAVIGAGAGAVTGAMVSEKKGKGAVVGGILGAGAGLGVGAIIDKKQGR